MALLRANFYQARMPYVQTWPMLYPATKIYKNQAGSFCQILLKVKAYQKHNLFDGAKKNKPFNLYHAHFKSDI